MKKIIINEHEVSTDGRTIWVNSSTKCVARLNKAIAELFDTGRGWLIVDPTDEDFTKFTKVVAELYDVQIPEIYNPFKEAPCPEQQA